MEDELSPIRHTARIGIPADLAFDLFTDEIGIWWPIAYTFSLAAFADAQIEDAPGGAWFETDNHGIRRVWGEVRIHDRPLKLVLSLAVTPGGDTLPAGQASEIELRFTAEDAEHSRLDLEHRNFGKMGQGAAQWRGQLASPQGWPVILACFARHARHSSIVG